MRAFRDQIVDQQRAAGVRVIKPPHALGSLIQICRRGVRAGRHPHAKKEARYFISIRLKSHSVATDSRFKLDPIMETPTVGELRFISTASHTISEHLHISERIEPERFG
jgi:hypothetical protein